MDSNTQKLDLENSRSLLVQTVEALYAERHSPVPGAVVKAQIIRDAVRQGASFTSENWASRTLSSS